MAAEIGGACTVNEKTEGEIGRWRETWEEQDSVRVGEIWGET
jgi:hypothetical protein